MVPIGIFLSDDVVKRVMKQIGFSFFITVPPIGLRGGLVFCWRQDFNFSIVWKPSNILHLKVILGGEWPNFSCSLVYGRSDYVERKRGVLG